MLRFSKAKAATKKLFFSSTKSTLHKTLAPSTTTLFMQQKRSFAWSSANPPEDMDAEFPESWMPIVDKETKGKGPTSLLTETPEGIVLKPLYTKADADKVDEPTPPGVFHMYVDHMHLCIHKDHGRFANMPDSVQQRKVMHFIKKMSQLGNKV